MRQYSHDGAPRDRPIEQRNVMIIAERVVSIQTQHVGESIWLATGHISEQLPTLRRLASPTVLTATGRTEAQSVEALKQLITRRQDDIPG